MPQEPRVMVPRSRWTACVQTGRALPLTRLTPPLPAFFVTSLSAGVILSSW